MKIDDDDEVNEFLNYYKRDESVEIDSDETTTEPILGSETPTKHCAYVWDNIVCKFACSTVAIVANGSGSLCALNLLRDKGIVQ
jgi:hypothetical protein